MRAVYSVPNYRSMADDPTKRKRDAGTISNQHHEIVYALRKLREQNPRRHQTTLSNALQQAKSEAQPSESRTKIMNRAQRIIDQK